jgi:uncharacterized membrane protein YphA (DoxX/SURF4 family)
MQKLIWLGLRLLGITLIFSGCYKLFYYQGIVTGLASYVIVPRGSENFIAPALVVAELWLGICLMGGFWLRHVLPSTVVLLTVFTAALTLDWMLTPDRSCGYWFAVTLGRGNLLGISRNLTMIVVASFAWHDLTVDHQAN